MNFTSLASSSRGNAYLLQAEGSSLLLEAGLPIKRLREKLREHEISLSDLAGCLVSHEHGDHSKAVKDLLKAGVDCWMSGGTAIELEVLGHHRLHIVSASHAIPGGKYFFTSGIPSGWRGSVFDLEHDASEPIGFFIGHGDEHLLFIPDTAYVENRFEGITMIAVECNNIAEILSRNILEGHIPAIVGKRVRRNHMSLENLIAMLKANDLSRCRAIYLMHLSDGNSDERRMKEEIQAATGIPTYAL
jgi:phosphoribosyl 1,2-cyclic phosphodiesterase